jgi:ferrous iron transport protein A
MKTILKRRLDMMPPAPVRSPRYFPLVGLHRLPCNARALIRGVEGDLEAQAWLAAVGIGCGEGVTVLRRAPFGGPLHVRTGTGGEFAIDVTLARTILVAPGREEHVELDDRATPLPSELRSST